MAGLQPYRIPNLEEEITQGDVLLAHLPRMTRHPDSGDWEPSTNEEPNLVVILTQACDIARYLETAQLSDSQLIVVAPVYSVADLVEAKVIKKTSLDNLIRFRVYGMYPLLPFQDANLPFSVVDLRQLYTLPFGLLTGEGANQRVARIGQLFREQLNLFLAQTYGRIGLPQNHADRLKAAVQEFRSK